MAQLPHGKPLRSVFVCIVLGLLALITVPFVGTRYGDVNEAIALVIGLVFIGLAALIYFNALERRVSELEAKLGGGPRPGA